MTKKQEENLMTQETKIKHRAKMTLDSEQEAFTAKINKVIIVHYRNHGE